MCGICGLVSLDGASGPDPAALAAMNETLLHRGPDSEGSLVDGPVGLAMRRLSIIDLEGGDQPISNEDGRICVI
jgi:asparagine synthase (glutamine-hydrolysing)